MDIPSRYATIKHPVRNGEISLNTIVYCWEYCNMYIKTISKEKRYKASIKYANVSSIENTNKPLLKIVIIAKTRHFTMEAATSLFIFRAYLIQINMGMIINNNKTIYILSIRNFSSTPNIINSNTLYKEKITCQIYLRLLLHSLIKKKTTASQILFMKQQSLFCRHFYFSTGKETVTWNRSPSRRISNFPPIRSVRLLAI